MGGFIRETSEPARTLDIPPTPEVPHLKDDSDVREIMRPIVEHWERMHRALAVGWKTHNGQSEPLLLGAIGLALDFQSWRTMARQQGLADEQAVELMVSMVRCVAQG
jgi:hypothetical protein